MLGIIRPSDDIVTSRDTFKVAKVLFNPVAVQPRVPVALMLGGIPAIIESNGQLTIGEVPVDESVSQIGGGNESVVFKL